MLNLLQILLKIFNKYGLNYPIDDKVKEIELKSIEYEWNNKVLKYNINSRKPNYVEKKDIELSNLHVKK